MEVEISPYHQQQHQVPHYSQQVNPQEEHKECGLDVGVGREPEEDKLCDCAVVPQVHLQRPSPRSNIKKHRSQRSFIQGTF